MPLTPAEVLDEVRAGRRVIVITDSHATGRELFLSVVESIPTDEGVFLARGSNGNERVSHPSGGWALFGPSGRGRWRGYTADTIDFRNPPTLEARAELIPCVMSSPAGVIIGADAL